MSKVKVSRGEFAGKPLLVIHDANAKQGDKAIISFGIKKAEAILAALEELKAFIQEHGKEEL